MEEVEIKEEEDNDEDGEDIPFFTFEEIQRKEKFLLIGFILTILKNIKKITNILFDYI